MNAVKENLKVYLPSIYKFLENQDFPWDRINNKFNKVIEKRILDSSEDNQKFEATIYDMIIDVRKGNNNYNGLLFFFNRLFEELLKGLDFDGRKTVKTTVKNLLISFDHKFLNFIGELAVLNNLLKSGNVKLIKCEVSLDNNKSIDLDVQFIKENKRALIEIYNIHLDSNRITNDQKEIEQFLKKRLLSKRNDKTKDSEFRDKIHLIPVLWGSYKSLKIYEEFYNSCNFYLPLTYEPMVYVVYKNENNEYQTFFDPITKVFKY